MPRRIVTMAAFLGICFWGMYCVSDRSHSAFFTDAELLVHAGAIEGAQDRSRLASDCVVRLIESHRPMAGRAVVITHVRTSNAGILVTDSERFEIVSLQIEAVDLPAQGMAARVEGRVFYSRGSLHGAHRCIGFHSAPDSTVMFDIRRVSDGIEVSLEAQLPIQHVTGIGAPTEVRMQMKFMARPGDLRRPLGLVGDVWDSYITGLRRKPHGDVELPGDSIGN